MRMTKTEERLVAIKDIKDPLIKKEVNNLLDAIELSRRFKRIDMAFLQMMSNQTPKFAILPYHLFLENTECRWEGNGFAWNEKGSFFPGNFREIFMAPNGFVMGGGEFRSTYPNKTIPETIKAQVENNKEHFDKLFVAWEADWLPDPKDPIVIGQKGRFYFIVATWDLTKLESYVCAEFSE